MRRNLGRDMLAVASVIVVMTTALTFGVVLSSISGADSTPVAQSNTVPEPTDTRLAEATSTFTVESTAVAVVESPTRTARATSTDAPTEEATVTDRPTHTQTVAASSTASWTPRPSRTPALSVTATLTPSATVTLRPTRTPRPSQTPAETLPPTRTPSATLAVLLAGDLGIVATPTPVITVTPTACLPPDEWVAYTVEPDITLFMIALSIGVDVPTLQTVNCIMDANQIIAGQVIYMPRLPDFAGLVHHDSIGCDNPGLRIVSPRPNARMVGRVAVRGSATSVDFGYYKLEIRADDEATYHFLMRSSAPVTDGVLGEVDTALFAPGVYWLRLALVDQTGNVAPDATCVIPMIFE